MQLHKVDAVHIIFSGVAALLIVLLALFLDEKKHLPGTYLIECREHQCYRLNTITGEVKEIN